MKFRIKICTSYYFDGVTKLGDFDIGNILTDEKSQKKNLIYDISY